jgi:glutamine amidotransferase
MIVILDYGMGNTGSIINMIRRIGGDAIVSADEQDISTAVALILPGVGAFDNGMGKLRESGMLPLIEKRVFEDKIPFLGICLGMQLLFDSSEEGALQGLGWISGGVKRFDFSGTNEKGLKIPHMGWNLVNTKQDHPLFVGLGAEARFYFVHSYHAVCSDEHHAIAFAEYGYSFACGVQKENIFGVQFHPEKSHKFGMTLFKNFVEQIC